MCVTETVPEAIHNQVAIKEKLQMIIKNSEMTAQLAFRRRANVCHYVGPTSFCPSAQRWPKITSVLRVMRLVCELAH